MGQSRAGFASRLTKAMLVMGARRGRKVEQKELAAVCGVTEGAVTQWVTGRTVPGRIEAYVALAELLGVSIDWLATGKGTGPLLDADSGAMAMHSMFLA